MTLQTGGSAFGLISTKSNVLASAKACASVNVTTPNGSPSTPTKRTSLTLVISSLIGHKGLFIIVIYSKKLELIKSSGHYFAS